MIRKFVLFGLGATLCPLAIAMILKTAAMQLNEEATMAIIAMGAVAGGLSFKAIGTWLFLESAQESGPILKAINTIGLLVLLVLAAIILALKTGLLDELLVRFLG